MTMSNTPLDLFNAGRLKDATAAATDQVRKAPTDQAARMLLVDLFLFAGELERADKQLDALSTQDPQVAVAVSMLRHVVRAEQARQKFFAEGAMPDFLELPGERLQLLLKASIALREKNDAEALDFVRTAHAMFPKLKGVCDDRPFEGLRDADDLTASVFEVLAPNGKYYWIPMENVRSLTLTPPKRLRDLLWRQGRLVLESGVDTETFFPAVYAGSNREPLESYALGQMTEFRAAAGGALARGVGQRALVIGGEDRPFIELKTLTVEA